MKKISTIIALTLCCYIAGAQNKDTLVIANKNCYLNTLAKCMASPECVTQCLGGNPTGAPNVACGAAWLLACAFGWLDRPVDQIEVELPMWAKEFPENIND